MIEKFNLPPPPGLQGLHPDKPITYYMRDLPHWRQDGATYFVTFRLADALPQTKLKELDSLRQEWRLRFPNPDTTDQIKQLSKEVMLRIEKWLDQGIGDCRLRQEDAWTEVSKAMHYFDDDRYELGCYAVMPNHVHVIVRPLQTTLHPLEKVLQSWKRHTSREIHKLDDAAQSDTNSDSHQSGVEHPPLWQPESFDRIIRDEEHLYRIIQYIGRNPRMAKLPPNQYCVWLKPQWASLGYRFEKY